MWFAQAEAQFELAGTTCQLTKYNYVVSQLNQQQAAEVEDIITSPPQHEPYDRLKAELVRRLSTSGQQRASQLLSHEEMGDRKPSQFLQHLRTLAPGIKDDFLRPVWTSRLPPHIQAKFTGQTEGSLDSAAQLADGFCEVTPQPTTANVSPVTPDNTARLLDVIQELSHKFTLLEASQTHSRSQSRDCRRSTSKKSPISHNVCWYRWRFGDEARKCTPPCSRQQLHQQT
jgi:hypothetical protein